MRVTKSQLIETAKNNVKTRTANDPNIACVFLVGSLTTPEPFVGGNTDIDLVFIHNSDPSITREIIPIAPEYHFDIRHYGRRVFTDPKNLRQDPWTGCLFCEDPEVLFNTYHLFEFLRAGVFSGFFSPNNVFARSHGFISDARQRWIEINRSSKDFSHESILEYLLIISSAANAIACLSGKPLPERRFLTSLDKHAEYLGRPGLSVGFSDLYAIENYDEFAWDNWEERLVSSFNALNMRHDCPITFSKPRIRYYMKAIDAYKSERPHESLWMILWLWTRILEYLPKRSLESRNWEEFCSAINLDQSTFTDRIQQADLYLDAVEETMDTWSNVSGLT